MSLELITPLVTQLGFGGFVGFIIGYALKKLLKIVAILIGLFFAVLMYLEYSDYIKINYDKIIVSFEELVLSVSGGGFSIPSFLGTNIPFAGSLIAGFGLGFKMG